MKEIFLIKEQLRQNYSINSKFNIFRLIIKYSEINVFRFTLQEINQKAKLDSNGELTIEDKIIGLIYFRGGYDEKDFPNEVIY